MRKVIQLRTSSGVCKYVGYVFPVHLSTEIFNYLGTLITSIGYILIFTEKLLHNRFLVGESGYKQYSIIYSRFSFTIMNL